MPRNGDQEIMAIPWRNTTPRRGGSLGPLPDAQLCSPDPHAQNRRGRGGAVSEAHHRYINFLNAHGGGAVIVSGAGRQRRLERRDLHLRLPRGRADPPGPHIPEPPMRCLLCAPG